MSNNNQDKAPQEEKQCPKCDCSGGAPAWMVTYSDLVTLLLTFFVLLLSMASMDEVKFTAASSSIRDAFGVHSKPARIDFSLPILPSVPISKFAPIQNEMATKIYKRIESQIKESKVPEDIELIKKDNDTIILRINNSILFNKGQSTVSPTAYPLLRKIADIIRPLPMRLRIEGHTDSSPVSTRKIDNWNLSVERAVSVMRFFKKSDLLPLDRMAAIGYGSERPVAPNTSEENMTKNRRVDFVLRANTLIGIGPTGAKPGEIPL
ncbi:MAG: OmpA family protein [Proteobacteria bacterium]|nr:OmpA family protein [Pseudomonadota bacterium]